MPSEVARSGLEHHRSGNYADQAESGHAVVVAVAGSHQVGWTSVQPTGRWQPPQGGNVSPLLNAILVWWASSPCQMPDLGQLWPV